MKQISNWVFGSFFRTIGRLLVFVLLGILLAHLIDFGSLKDSFSITDLFFTKIKASTYQQVQIPLKGGAGTDTLTLCKDYNIMYTGWANKCYKFNLTAQTPKQENFSFWLIDTQGYTIPTGASEVIVQMTTSAPYISPSALQVQGASLDTYSFFSLTMIVNGGTNIICTRITDSEPYVTFSCPINSGSTIINRFYVQATMYSENARYVLIGMDERISFVFDTGRNTTSAINEQTQQQQQQHNETQSYLEDSNTTQAESEATDFFDDFDAPDAGGLSAIITAPLNTIRSLLNSSCTNLVLPLPYVNENLTLPCMTSIYTQHFGAFFTIYQTIILAIIAYRCIRSIFFDIHGFTNPNDDRIEVMDL